MSKSAAEIAAVGPMPLLQTFLEHKGYDIQEAIEITRTANSVRGLEHMAEPMLLCQSPMERRLIFSGIGHSLDGTFVKRFIAHDNKWHVLINGAPFWLEIQPQARICGFNVDFCISPGDTAWPGLRGIDRIDAYPVVIEVDGHEFHEKTKEQVERDKARERKLVSCGAHVLRFAGSEIHANSSECFREAMLATLRIHKELAIACRNAVGWNSGA